LAERQFLKLRKVHTARAAFFLDGYGPGMSSCLLLLREHFDEFFRARTAPSGVPDDQRHTVLAGLLKGVPRICLKFSDAVVEIPEPFDDLAGARLRCAWRIDLAGNLFGQGWSGLYRDSKTMMSWISKNGTVSWTSPAR
jgi:hypothetical protein